MASHDTLIFIVRFFNDNCHRMVEIHFRTAIRIPTTAMYQTMPTHEVRTIPLIRKVQFDLSHLCTLCRAMSCHKFAHKTPPHRPHPWPAETQTPSSLLRLRLLGRQQQFRESLENQECPVELDVVEKDRQRELHHHEDLVQIPRRLGVDCHEVEQQESRPTVGAEVGADEEKAGAEGDSGDEVGGRVLALQRVGILFDGVHDGEREGADLHDAVEEGGVHTEAVREASRRGGRNDDGEMMDDHGGVLAGV
mmetsp:Transcript_9087/g.24541  ORF Transcript_9087/g.24541 Transcript_9087/m.24541 type:complete len:250 (-) Transcript_9087:582-1331(-)